MKLSRHDFFDQSNHHLPFSILRSQQVNYPLHENNFAELVIVEDGTGNHFTDKSSHHIKRGDIFIVTAESRHGYRDVENLRITSIHFNSNILTAPLADIATIPGYHALFKIEPHFSSHVDSQLLLSEPQLLEAMDITNKIEREINNESIGCIFFSKIYFLELIGFLARCYDSQETEKSNDVLRIAEAISYIERNYTKDIEQDDLAKIANLSKSHFLHIFKKTTNTTPLSYQKHLRMDKACSLLRQSKMSITEISHKCGYHDSNYFTRQFKKVLDISPKQYRNNSQKIEIPQPQ